MEEKTLAKLIDGYKDGDVVTDVLTAALSLAIDQTNVAIDGLEEQTHSSYGELRADNEYELMQILGGV